MKLDELIDKLQDMQQQIGEDGIKVMSSSTCCDRTHTEQLNEINLIEICIPRRSAYSNTGLAFSSRREVKGENNERVLVLRF